MAEAIALYERALMHNSKYTDAMYNLGVAFGETGQVRKDGKVWGSVPVSCLPAFQLRDAQ